MNIKIISFLYTICILSAQVVTTIPLYPGENDTIRVIFNAGEGDQGLMGYGEDVYAHTGLITEYSTSSSDWKYVIGEWGDNSVQPKMTRDSTNFYHLDIVNIRDFYHVSNPDEEILKLAFVFRSHDSQYTGREAGGADIFTDIFQKGTTVIFLEPRATHFYGKPERSPVFLSKIDTLHLAATAAVIETELNNLTLIIDGDEITQTEDDTLIYDYPAPDADYGMHTLTVVAEDSASATDSTTIAVMINTPVEDIARPENTQDGINYINDATALLSLFAPHKKYVYVLGDFNDWQVNTDYYMKRDSVDIANVWWWLEINGLTSGQEYAFQYLVDGEIRIADSYTEKVLDPWNDSYISPVTYPDLKPYPAGKTQEPVSVLQTAQNSFTWIYSDTFQRPPKEKLVIYELLVRDFIAAHDFKTLIDTLPYFEKLGINAIELMPVNEFEGNLSWGYNPSFYFAPDKYYGPGDDLKSLIDACHQKGIAVIMDIVLNHSYGQSPLVRLYFDSKLGRPSADNPWYNQQSPNPTYSWGYDFNHQSAATEKFVDRVIRYWLQEYRVDGFRFDFTKGFTNTSGDGGAYDAQRISILKRMADQMRAVDSTAYIILEHFTDNDEEKELADYDMMIWGNSNYNYNEATMGWHGSNNSNFFWGYYGTRGWTEANLVTYMESHDEERLMYKNLQYGNSSGTYNIQELSTALERIKMAAAFFLTYPGQKMIWQFGELGYDVSIDYNGRTGEKPIRWFYYTDNDPRKKLFETFATLIKIRSVHPVFYSQSTQVDLSVSGAMKRIKLTHPEMNVVIVGNFNVVADSINPMFHHGNTWYDYFPGDSLTDIPTYIHLQPGEFHIYTDIKLPVPPEGIVNNLNENLNAHPRSYQLYQNYPNPFNPETTICYRLAEAGKVKLEVFNILGEKITSLVDRFQKAGNYRVRWNGKNHCGVPVASGIYIYRLMSGKFSSAHKLALIR